MQTKEGDSIKNAFPHTNDDIVQAAMLAFVNIKFETLTKGKSIADGKFRKFAVKIDTTSAKDYYNIQAHVKDVLGSASIISQVQLPIGVYKQATTGSLQTEVIAAVKQALEHSLLSWKSKNGKTYCVESSTEIGQV
jgi:hypothetical protein